MFCILPELLTDNDISLSDTQAGTLVSLNTACAFLVPILQMEPRGSTRDLTRCSRSPVDGAGRTSYFQIREAKSGLTLLGRIPYEDFRPMKRCLWKTWEPSISGAKELTLNPARKLTQLWAESEA